MSALLKSRMVLPFRYRLTQVVLLNERCLSKYQGGCWCFEGVKAASSMWPPPAPPEYIDQAQLPVNLRPPSVAPRQREEKDEDNNRDDVSDSTGAPLVSRQSSASEAHSASTATDHTKTSHSSREHHASPAATSDSQMTRPPSDMLRDRQPRPQDDVTHDRQSDVTHDREVSHQLKRSSAGDGEPGVQAKRLSDGAVHDGSLSFGSGEARMDVQCSDEARGGPYHVSDVQEPRTRHGPDAPSIVSREEVEEPCRSANDEPRTVPPRLMETGQSDDPMVIEFSAAGGGSGNDDDVSVRAGHKRARLNSDNVHNDVVKKSFVKRPVMFYGN